MHRYSIWLALALFSVPVCAQTNATDSQNLKALLDEVRMLRHDLQTTTITSQRVQIALYRMQLQNAAIEQKEKVVEDIRKHLADVSEGRKHVVSDLQKMEDARDQEQDAQQRKLDEDAVPQLKRHAEQLAAEEQEWQSRVSEAEGELNLERNKMSALQNLVDQLEHTLEYMASHAASPAPSK